jgi:hypothetical protein
MQIASLTRLLDVVVDDYEEDMQRSGKWWRLSEWCQLSEFLIWQTYYMAPSRVMREAAYGEPHMLILLDLSMSSIGQVEVF